LLRVTCDLGLALLGQHCLLNTCEPLSTPWCLGRNYLGNADSIGNLHKFIAADSHGLAHLYQVFGLLGGAEIFLAFIPVDFHEKLLWQFHFHSLWLVVFGQDLKGRRFGFFHV
jgi:hypothetical protein